MLEDGTIIESGDHASLTALGGKYAQLVKQQSLDTCLLYTSILGLAPSWIDNFSYQLNIKKRFLNISISRDGAAFDEKLIELRQYIGQIILDAFGQSPLTLGHYLSDGRKRLVCEYEAENELVSRAVQVLVLSLIHIWYQNP